MDGIIFPPSLQPGDRIAIVSPASPVKEEYIDGAVRFFMKRGYDPVVFPSAKGPSCGSYAASLGSRLADIKDALHDKSIKAIFCSRGGYGCVHLLPYITFDEIRSNPKWLIGFSDISALHALWLKSGIASVHSPMAKHLTIEEPSHESTKALFSILENEGRFDYSTKTFSKSRIGKTEGILHGGNLAVLNGLASTPYDILSIGENEDVILFLEDISEAIYAVERMLYRLYLSGTLSRVKGLIFGQFTEYRPDKNHQTMEEMIDGLLHRVGIHDIPVAMNFPVGHVSHNLPLTEGAPVSFTVTPSYTTLETLQ